MGAGAAALRLGPGLPSPPQPLTAGVTGLLREGDQESRLGNLGRPLLSLDKANCLAAGPLAAARAEVVLEGGGRNWGFPCPLRPLKPRVRVR